MLRVVHANGFDILRYAHIDGTLEHRHNTRNLASSPANVGENEAFCSAQRAANSLEDAGALAFAIGIIGVGVEEFQRKEGRGEPTRRVACAVHRKGVPTIIDIKPRSGTAKYAGETMSPVKVPDKFDMA